MHFGIKIGWTTVLETDAQVIDLVRQLRELVMTMGSQGLYAQVLHTAANSRMEDVAGEMPMVFRNARDMCRNSQLQAGVRLKLHPTPAVPEDFRSRPTSLVVHFPPGLRERPEAYPVVFTWPTKPLRDEQLVTRLERFLHLLAPSWVRFEAYYRSPYGDYWAGPTSLMYFDAEHVAQLRALGVPIKPAAESKLGAWFRVHDEAVDSMSKAAWRAHRVFWASVDPLFDKRKLEAQRRWRPTPGLGGSTQGPTGMLAPGSGAPPVELPSYLVRAAEAVAPALAAPVVSSHARIVGSPSGAPPVDETVLGARALVGNAIPFSGSVQPPPATPVEPSPEQGETAMLPVSSELLAAVARSQARDARVAELDATLLPIPNRRPVIPFAGATSPEHAKALAGPPAAPSDDVGETLMLPVAEGLAELAAHGPANQAVAQTLARPSMPLHAYAMLRHALSTAGADQEQVRSRFGVSAEELRRIEQQYFELFRAEPKTQQAFVSLLQRLRNPGAASGGH
jgi:hypothetical protein